MVLDVDGADGKASLQTLTAAHGSLPKTLCARTGRKGTDGKRKGAHYYFRAPVGVPIRNSAGILGKGLDIRADGGYEWLRLPPIRAGCFMSGWHQSSRLPICRRGCWQNWRGRSPHQWHRLHQRKAK